jgi:hypothetical protein
VITKEGTIGQSVDILDFQFQSAKYISTPDEKTIGEKANRPAVAVVEWMYPREAVMCERQLDQVVTRIACRIWTETGTRDIYQSHTPFPGI